MSDAITLTDSQLHVLNQLKAFIQDPKQRVFILKGYAGTGKTTLMRFLVQHLQQIKKPFELLAPTGRAAKVLSDLAIDNRFDDISKAGKTIHGLIFRYNGFNREISDEEIQNNQATGQLSLIFDIVELDEKTKPTVYIVDEASMISDSPAQIITQAQFGSGQLLTELLNYDKRPESKYIFVGDPCQLPPVGDDLSPALSEQSFTPPALSASLTEIMRQADGNDLIRVSKQIRSLIPSAPDSEQTYGNRKLWTKYPLRQCRNVQLHSNINDMVNHYVNNIKQNGYNNSIFVCQTNKQASQLSIQVRHMLGYQGDLPVKGDLLLVIQNNNPTGLVNGDMVEVTAISPHILKRAGLRFTQIRVKETFSDREFSLLILLDTLNSNTLNLNTEQQTALFIDFCKRMKEKGISPKKNKERFEELLRTDPYLNALRCTYGYAVTCHKAQGGEWLHVYLNPMRNIGLSPTKQKYRWMYTAITRAKETLHLVDDTLYLQ